MKIAVVIIYMLMYYGCFFKDLKMLLLQSGSLWIRYRSNTLTHLSLEVGQMGKAKDEDASPPEHQ